MQSRMREKLLGDLTDYFTNMPDQADSADPGTQRQPSMDPEDLEQDPNAGAEQELLEQKMRGF